MLKFKIGSHCTAIQTESLQTIVFNTLNSTNTKKCNFTSTPIISFVHCKNAAYSLLLYCLAISSNLTNLLLGLAYIFIRWVSSEVWRRVFDAAAPAEHGPVPSNHSAGGGLASAATSPLPHPPPSHLPDNGQRTPDKLVWVSHCSVHCTALNAGETKPEQTDPRRRGRAGVDLSLRQLFASPTSSRSLVQCCLPVSHAEINLGLKWNLLTRQVETWLPCKTFRKLNN